MGLEGSVSGQGTGWGISGFVEDTVKGQGFQSPGLDSCITQLKPQGPSRTCNESKEEEEESGFPESGQSRTLFPESGVPEHLGVLVWESSSASLLLPSLELSDTQVYEP